MASATQLVPGDWIQFAIANTRTDVLLGDLGIFLNKDLTWGEIGLTLWPGWCYVLEMGDSHEQALRNPRRDGAESALSGPLLDLQELFDQAPGFMAVLVGPEHVFRVVNRAYYQLVGHRDLLGKTVQAALPDIAGQGFYELLDRVYTTGEAASGEAAKVTLQQTADAPPTEAYLDFVYQPLRNSARAVTGIFVQGHNVTQRVIAEERLRKLTDEIAAQARTFNTALSAIKDFAYIFDRRGRFLYVNKPLLDLWGLPLSAAIGKNFFDLAYPHELAARLQRQIEQVFATRAPLVDETPYTSPTGQGGYYEYIFTPVMAADGSVEVVAGSTRDITERHQAEHMLREMDRRKDEFLATLAHELRNPLAPIRFASSIINKDGATDAQHKWGHAVIERQVQHMSRLLDDLLDISRITSGKLELKKSIVALDDAIAAALEIARPFVEARGHTVTTSTASTPFLVEADPVRLAQILGNLLVNAAKYTDPGGTIRLEAHAEKGTAVIRVVDTGIGIVPGMLTRIFEMFSQVDTALERAEGGLGIGLAIVSGLTKLHGGSIEARSEGLGRGSEFILRLPIGAALRTARSAEPLEVTPAPPRRILVVDDNRDAAESLGMLLGLDGHDVQVVHDGYQALVAAEAFEPEVMLLDIGMPGLSGYEVAQIVRGRSWGARITMVALTGWGQEEAKARAARAGFDHHLVKPVSPRDITRILAG